MERVYEGLDPEVALSYPIFFVLIFTFHLLVVLVPFVGRAIINLPAYLLCLFSFKLSKLFMVYYIISYIKSLTLYWLIWLLL